MAIDGSRLVTSSSVAGATISDSSTAASLLTAAQKKVLPANYFYVGKILRVYALGAVSNVITTPGTLTVDLRLNSTPIVVVNGGAMQMSTTAHTSAPIWIQFILTCRAVGSGTSANLMGQGIAISQALSVSTSDSTSGHGALMHPATAPAVGTGFNSTANNVLDLFGKFSVATSPTNITIQQFIVEELN